jgi:hypothetical protein
MYSKIVNYKLNIIDEILHRKQSVLKINLNQPKEANLPIYGKFNEHRM